MHQWILFIEKMDLSPKIRYSDMSYIIYQQWQKAGVKAAFPVVFNFLYNKHKFDNQNSQSLTSVNEKEKISEPTTPEVQSKTNRTKEPSRKKRRSRSLDRIKRAKNSNNLKIDEHDGNDSSSSCSDTTLDNECVDSTETIVAKNASNEQNSVKVDVHHRPDSVVVVNKSDSPTVTKEALPVNVATTVPENSKQDLTMDLNHNTLVNNKNIEFCDSDDNLLLSVPIRRKEFVPISDSSSFDESDDTETGYATVQLRDLKNYDAQNQQTIPKSQSFPVPAQYQKSPATTAAAADNLGLNYVTERILGSVLPRRNNNNNNNNNVQPQQQQIRPHSEGQSPQDVYEKELVLMLEQKHGKNYKMFDLESCISTITLEKLCELCKHIDSWLGSGREKVVVLQDRGDKQRLGAAIAAYLEYLDICASNYPKRNGLSNEDVRAQNTIARNWLDLDIFSMKKFLEDVIGPLRVPSHRRYLHYFSGLLSGKIKMNSSPLYLQYVSIESPPLWSNYESITSQNGEWRSFVKIYEGLNCVFTSDIHVIPISTRQFVYEIGQLRLRGDVIVRCYQIIPNERGAYQEKRELMFSTQFHTCAVTDKTVSFNRNELDYACDDPRFPTDHKVTLHFATNAQLSDNKEFIFQSPLIKIEPMNAIAKYDSLEQFDDGSSQHTQGPLDGSLYATILKSPKTPDRSPSSKIPLFPITGETNNNGLETPQKPQRAGSAQNLILSPPPEFSNTKLINHINERYSNGTTTIVHNNNNYNTIQSQRNTYTPTPTNYEDIRIPSRSSSRTTSFSGHQGTPRPGSAQSQYLEQRSSVSRQSNYTPNPNSYPQSSHQIRPIEAFHYSSVLDNGGQQSQNGGQNYQDGRESVRSPLTLSMDSGISSSGVVIRRAQGSSVSPSSFPSQASPQEDRHRELDDILSDMLLTVQDIPDIGSNNNSKQNVEKTLTKSHNHHHHHNLAPNQQQQSQQQPQYQYNTDTVKRSHTSREDRTTITARDRELMYDTSSTTTTITPPPSESGRDTPLISNINNNNNNSNNNNNINNNNNNHHHQHHTSNQRDKREIIQTTTSTVVQRNGSNNDRIMDLQNQSYGYPQESRSEIVYVTSEDEENIPYHAREDSRPFTYGNPGAVQLSPNGTGMLKMQSGLSSPSLVRKTLGGSSVGGASGGGGGSSTLSNSKKTHLRNDFEEMLMQRRDKVLSEKYSIGDKTPNGLNSNSYATSEHTKWSNISSPTNGYHYHEPLKRSNTMDGGFGRSNSTDGTGQTWLQLQQQKLRAKKEQQKGGDYFERTVHTEVRNRPLRSRSAARGYDGYASDTAAFDAKAFIDEVDYIRPLHIQTPHRSADRNYHTLTTTTTVTQQNKERPFVTIKRAHEQGKLNSIGSSPVSPLSVLNASPHGHISQAQSPISNSNNNINNNHNNNSNHNNSNQSNQSNSNGLLLSFADSNSNSNLNNSNNNLSPRNNNGHARLESDSSSDLILPKNGDEAINNKKSKQHLNGAVAKGDNACGQLALDRLLASLAIENDIMDQQLAQINSCSSSSGNGSTISTVSSTSPDFYKHRLNGVNTDINHNDDHTPDNVFTFPTIKDQNCNHSTGGLPTIKYEQSNGVHSNLNDVLANLTDFSRHETIRQLSLSTNGGNYSPNLVLNSRQQFFEPTNSALKRLASESENSSSISPSLSERSNGVVSWSDQVREESFSSYRSETEPETSIGGSPRPETPAFPVTPRTPYGGYNGNTSPALPPKSPTSLRRLNNSTWSLRSAKSSLSHYDWSKDLYSGNTHIHHQIINQNDAMSCYTSRRNSVTSNANSEPQEVAPHLVKFVRDSSKYWYKPTISREEAVALLRNAAPGTFIVRDSTTFAKAFGLVVKVAYPPPGVQSKGPPGDELVRHFLVEPTTRGVRLKGCANEPVFSSLSALVYQHSITPLALPCRLIIPEYDMQGIEFHSPAQQQLITQGAACNILYLFTCETESLTGPEAVRKAISYLFTRKPLPQSTEVHFKVSQQGITLTDNSRQLFFRKHYPAANISFCGLDPDDRRWSIRTTGDVPVSNKTIFAFVARRSTSSTDNQCHVFCELEPTQPATAITSFANKVIPSYGHGPAVAKNL